MKFFHKKFLNQQEVYKATQNSEFEKRAKISYFINQFIIWGVICCVCFLVIKLLFMDYN